MSNKHFTLDRCAPNLGASDLMRLGYVRRWGIVSTIREQDVASHSCRVALLTMYVIDRVVSCGAIPEHFRLLFLQQLMPIAMAVAVVHDVPEVFTGDIPAPYKKWMAEKVDPLAEPFDLTWMFTKQDPVMGELAHEFVKWADLVESSAFLYDNCHTPHGKAVADQINTREACDRLIDYLDRGGYILEDSASVYWRVVLLNALSSIVSQLRMTNITDIGRSNWTAL